MFMTVPEWTVLVAIVAGITLLWHLRKANAECFPLPPGPKGLPLIGNVRDVPTAYQWLKYAEWAEEFDSDIIHIEVLGQHIIVLNSLQSAIDLLERRSSIYSDRPRLPMLNELMGWDWASSLMPYGPVWRRHRRATHQYFNSKVTQSYQPLQLLETRKMLRRLLGTPNDFMHHVRHTFSATVVMLVYGIQVSDSGDRYISIAEEALNSVAQAGIPGSFLVDTIPILKYVPEWFPGAIFKRQAREWRNLLPEFIDKPFQEVQARMVRGDTSPSIARKLLERIKDSPDYESEEKVARNVAAIAYAAGADTVVSTIQAFFLTMALHPEVQQKAQEQIDAVIGRERVPNLDDIASLPYIEAILREMLRWQQVTPLAVAHCVTTDDVYGGYRIPKGSIILGNSWAILHDEKMFPEPLKFIPERYLHADGTINNGILHPEAAAFGFGRRICPGRHLAMNGARIIVASVLSVFRIEPAVDDISEGPPISLQMTSGFISYPVPFKCKITSRYEGVADQISESIKSADQGY